MLRTDALSLQSGAQFGRIFGQQVTYQLASQLVGHSLSQVANWVVSQFVR